MERLKMSGRKREEKGPFLKIRKEGKFYPLGCSSQAEGTRGCFSCSSFSDGKGECLLDPVLNSCSDRGSTPRQRHDFEGNGKRSGPILNSSCGSTPRQEPNFESCQGPLREFGLPRGSSQRDLLHLPCDRRSVSRLERRDRTADGAEQAASGLTGLQADHRPDSARKADSLLGLVESSQSCRDRSLCHRAPLSTVASVSHLSSVLVGRGGCGARGVGRVSALCPCCGLDHVGGNDNICGECLSRALGDWSCNSCVEHGEGPGAGHVGEVAGETKPRSTSTLTGVWRSLDGTLPVGEELVSIHRGTSEEAGVRRPLDGLVSVGEELASDFRGRQEQCMLRHGRVALVHPGVAQGW